MKIYKKSIIFIILFCCVALNLDNRYVSFVKAEDKSDIKVIYLRRDRNVSNTIFNKEKLLVPGDKIVSEFYINNNNEFKSSINKINIVGELFNRSGEIIDRNKVEYNDFLNNSIIQFYCENKEIYKGTLGNFIDLKLSSDSSIEIDKNSSKKCMMEYEMLESAGNSIMGMEYRFDINFYYRQVGTGTMVQTGQKIDFKTLMIIGAFLCIIGLLLMFRKKVSNRTYD